MRRQQDAIEMKKIWEKTWSGPWYGKIMNSFLIFATNSWDDSVIGSSSITLQMLSHCCVFDSSLWIWGILAKTPNTANTHYTLLWFRSGLTEVAAL